MAEVQSDFDMLFGPGPTYESCGPHCLVIYHYESTHKCNSVLGLALSRDWPEQMQKARAQYTEMQQTYNIDPHASTDDKVDPDVDNPLSQSADSKWNVYFENNELQRMINQDIVRTYPEITFFQRADIRAMMLRVLFVYSKMHPIVSYKQGMHELLAPFIYLLERNKHKHAEASDNLIAFLCSDKYIEHDSFALFSKLMETTSVWFHSDPPKKIEAKSDSPLSGSGSSNSSRPTSPLPLQREPSNDEVTHSPIVKRCRYIQLTLLKEKDPQLQQYLDAMNIEPQLYALRWLRLLMGREFELEDLLQLWDALFAHSFDLKLIDYLAVAMLIFMRSHLVGQDYNRCMKRLFKFPPVDDVMPFVQAALRMHTEDTTIPKKELPAAATVPTPKPATVKAQSYQTPQQSATQKAVYSLSSSLSRVWGAEDKRQQEMLQAEIARLRTRDVHMAQRIERIIYSLLKELQEAPVATPEPAMDAVLVAIAELKQVKDILNGLLHDDAPAHLPPAYVPTASLAVTNSSPAPTPAPASASPTALTSPSSSPSGSAVYGQGHASTSPPPASSIMEPAKK